MATNASLHVSADNSTVANPLALIAELTYRCPLHCVYCSNPLQMVNAKSELSTEDWMRVFEEARRLGVVHLHLTGGEPLARPDILKLIAHARGVGLYTNLITSGIGLSEARLTGLVDAGMDHIQLSFQDSSEAEANWIAGARAHSHKVVLAEIIRRSNVAFTVNLVVHRQNLDHIDEMLAFAEQLNPDRLEVAHAQYYGWALKNREALLPTRAQVDRCMSAVTNAKQRLAGRMRIDCVLPDYYAKYPKACMGGWGRRLLLINPAGRVLPCHAANVIPDMQFENVRDRSLVWIWRESESFRRFRGEAWMPEPCRSCDRRGEDFGGCRCQALLLTGDANATDPACSLAPRHSLVEEARLLANSAPVSSERARAKEVKWDYRQNPD